MARSIFIVDDEALIRKSLVANLEAEGYHAIGFADAESALAVWEKELPSIVVLDLKLPGMDGVSALKELVKHDPAPEVIMITAYATIQTAVEAIQLGAFHFLPKPVRFRDLLVIIKRAEAGIDLRIGARAKLEPAEEKGFGAIIHKSPLMAKEIERCRKVAQSKATTVLITGESGTGKELFARALHYESARRGKALIEMNCLAIPETLFESELFGFRAGAFTDAKTSRRGLLELADGGSFFLDEIGDMPLNLQGKLLKVIEEKEFFVLGSESSKKVDIRFIVSSNRDLERLVAEGAFREDLYYRLNVVKINIPPLRERREDIVHLVGHFIAELNHELKKRVREIKPDAAELLQAYDWPGNVRQLKNEIERIMILEADESINVEHLSPEISDAHFKESVPARTNEGRTLAKLKDVEREHIARVLESSENRQGEAARILGIDRKTLYRKMKLYRLIDASDEAD